jgi:hypothetical protein
MDRKLILLLLGGCLTALSVACKQPVDYLPPATQTGQNTLGFLIDGKPYIPQGSSSLFVKNNPVSGGLISRGSYLGIDFYTYSSTDNNGSITVHLDDYKLGENPVSNGDVSKGNLIGRKYYAYYGRGKQYFYSSSSNRGWVNLTKADPGSGIVAGTFEFVLADTTGKTVTITDGRFDLNTRTQ